MSATGRLCAIEVATEGRRKQMPKRGVVRNLTRPNELRTSLAASGVIGTWEWDLLNRCVYYDEEAAVLHTGDRNLAGRPVRGLASIANVHPEDRE